MTAQEVIATIQAEIERLQTKWESADAMTEDLISFLSDLEESEKPIEGLEEEIERYLPQIPEEPNNEELRVLARHFAEWGAEHLKK